MEGWEELQSRSSLRAMLLGMRKQFLDLERPGEEEISFPDGEQSALEADGRFLATRGRSHDKRKIVEDWRWLRVDGFL
jgi:hypothetical protein